MIGPEFFELDIEDPVHVGSGLLHLNGGSLVCKLHFFPVCRLEAPVQEPLTLSA